MMPESFGGLADWRGTRTVPGVGMNETRLERGENRTQGLGGSVEGFDPQAWVL